MMQYRTTIGWSLITSGIVTLLLSVLPGNSVWWGIAFLILGTSIFFIRKS
ncbi:MAG: hypothetical protein SWJ54_11880 [Cyanobacteriota bacterium]|nr:hypothetical protein [Cyanobacteriota bacterium]